MFKKIFVSSLLGKRPTNEDKHYIYSDNFKQIFGVFDGHGGDKVSNYICNEFKLNIHKIKYPWSKKEIINLTDTIQNNLKKFDYSYNSGSTALIAAIYTITKDNKNKIFLDIMNIGDSRAILCNGFNIAIQLTKDHIPNSYNERKRIEKINETSKIKRNIINDGYSWRINGLSVSRAFGDFDSFPHLTHRPELYRYNIDTTDKFIIIACDGLWESLTNDEAVEFIINNYNKSKDKNIAELLANYAIEKGSMDNISVIIILFF